MWLSTAKIKMPHRESSGSFSLLIKLEKAGTRTHYFANKELGPASQFLTDH